MFDYVLKDTTAKFKVISKHADMCYCNFKVDLENNPYIFNQLLFPGAILTLIEASSGAVAEVEIIAIDVNETGRYTTNMTGSCAFQLLSEHILFGNPGSLVL